MKELFRRRKRPTEKPLDNVIHDRLKTINCDDGSTFADRDRFDGLSIQSGVVLLSIKARSAEEAIQLEPQRAQLQAELSELDGVSRATVALTASRNQSDPNALLFTPTEPAPASNQAPNGLREVSFILGVGSGKGGVGKSTVSVALAMALRDKGLRVGIADADVYGPSLPVLLNYEAQPDTDDPGFTPENIDGILASSIGGLVERGEPLVWRGPVASQTVVQLIRDTQWGPLDILIVDMPPGTGDIQLSLCNDVSLSAALIITTPHVLALVDAERAVTMFARLNIPALGIVENMSGLACDQCGTTIPNVFQTERNEFVSQTGLPMLAHIPSHMFAQNDPNFLDRIVKDLGPVADAVSAHLNPMSDQTLTLAGS